MDLVALAFSFGYRDVPAEGAGCHQPSGAVKLRHPATGDQLQVWRDAEGVWRYSSSADRLYGQTVVEFMLQRRRLGLGYVRKDLRWWMRERAARARARGS